MCRLQTVQIVAANLSPTLATTLQDTCVCQFACGHIPKILRRAVEQPAARQVSLVLGNESLQQLR